MCGRALITPARRGIRGMWAIALLVTAVGCSGSSVPTAHLAGKVTLGGKPIPSDAEAFIMFVNSSAEGKEAKVSVPIANGQYDSPDTPQGAITVTFSITRNGPTKTSARTGEQYSDVINLVPAKYSTGLPLQVTGDNTNQNFDL
ncbi:hypothetical protein [Aeoliella sp.]|uniref:hypothetical protein n=1 Tax=Aeoliella sp. TaxID=2795800 RepID=UPI003CCC3F27